MGLIADWTWKYRINFRTRQWNTEKQNKTKQTSGVRTEGGTRTGTKKAA
jgi:hypothetical protein